MGTNKLALESRRAEVAKMLVMKLSTRDIAATLGTSQSTIVGDIKHLRAQWLKDRGEASEMFEDAIHDLATLQREAFEILDEAVGLDRLAAIDRVLKITDQRNRLANLYPRPGTGEENDIPTGPIRLELTVVPAGNQRLIDPDPDDDMELPEGIFDV